MTPAMKISGSILNITLNRESGIYDYFRYPAGESQVRIHKEHLGLVESAKEIRIIARITSGEDIIELALLCNAIEGINDAAWLSLVLPYLPYGRADRRFVDGDCFGLRTFGSLLASMGPNRTVTFDAHSRKAELNIPELVDVSARPIIEQAIAGFAQTHKTSDVCVLFPDAGARDRYALPDHIGCNTEIINLKILNATKERDAKSGGLGGFHLLDWKDIGTEPILIVDDICDGGATFLGIVDMLPKTKPFGLYVSHGIFSKGLANLQKYFSWIGTTNSFYAEQIGPHVVGCVDAVYDVMPMLLRVSGKNYL